MSTKYRIQIGDEIIDFEGPDDLSDAEIQQLADQHLKTAKPGQVFPPSAYIGDVVDPSLAPQEEPESSAGGAFLRGAPQEATFNLADEISAFGNAAGLAGLDNLTGIVDNQQAFWDNPEGFWAAFENNLANIRNQYEADEAQHPVASATGKIGGVLSSLPRIGGAVATRLPQAVKTFASSRPILTTSVLGGTAGAASGYGAGEGETRGQSAALAGLTGFGLGPAGYAVSELMPIVANYAKIFFGKGSDKEAIRQIVKAMERDGFDVKSPTGVQTLRSALQEYTGKPVSLADLGGALRSRTGVGLRTPSNAQQTAIETIRDRQAGQGQRLAQDIRANVAPRTDVHALDEALVAQRAQEAGPLRERALFEESVGEPVFRGGAPFSATRQDRIQYFTPDEEAARSYQSAYKERFGREGVVEQARINFKNPAPEDVVRREAEKLDIPFDDATPASAFDVELYGDDALRLRDNLRKLGYDGTTLDDISQNYGTGGGSGGEIKALIPFDNSVVSMGGGRQSRIVDPNKYSDPEKYQLAVELQNLARLPDAQRALKAAQARAESERALLATTGQDISHIPDLGPGANLDVRAFDYLKRYLDDEVSALYRRGQGSTFSAGEAAQVRELRDAIRERLRNLVPEYGDYLDQYAGSSEMIDALREGADFRKLSPEQITGLQARRSQAGQELYRVGAARSLLNDVMSTKDNSNAANRILNSAEERAQLAATGVSPINAQSLNRAVQQERTFNLLPQELAGSQTAQRAISQADANAGVDLTLPFNPGSPLGWLGMVGRGVRDRVSLARNEAVNNELLPRLTTTDPVAIENTIKELEREGQYIAAETLRRRAAETRNALLGGVFVGGPVALEDR